MTGCRVQISHLKVDSPSRWGASAKALALIDTARKRGIIVEADQYAYSAASSSLGIRFPSWALEGGQPQINVRLNDAATWAKIKDEMRGLLAERGLADLSFAVVASYRADPSLNGLSMKQVAAKLKGAESADAQFEAAREMMLTGGASMVYHFMSDEDIDRIMKHPQVGIASDSSVLTMGEGVPHPRGYGNNARVLGEYVRARKVISLEEAVRKMTSLPADQFRFADRGRIAQGNFADIVVFDRDTVGEAATFEKPHAYARGIPSCPRQRGACDTQRRAHGREAGNGADAGESAVGEALTSYLRLSGRLNAPTALVHDEHDEPMNTRRILGTSCIVSSCSRVVTWLQMRLPNHPQLQNRSRRARARAIRRSSARAASSLPRAAPRAR